MMKVTIVKNRSMVSQNRRVSGVERFLGGAKAKLQKSLHQMGKVQGVGGAALLRQIKVQILLK